MGVCGTSLRSAADFGEDFRFRLTGAVCRECAGCISSAGTDASEKLFFDAEKRPFSRSDYMGCTDFDFGFGEIAGSFGSD